jgi:hypothetical protein
LKIDARDLFAVIWHEEISKLRFREPLNKSLSRYNLPQGLKPNDLCIFSARLKSCPDTCCLSKISVSAACNIVLIQDNRLNQRFPNSGISGQGSEN